MPGKPAARQGDAVSHGLIVQGSNTVLIGSQGGVACSVCPGGIAVGSPVNPAPGAKVLTDETAFALPAPAIPLIRTRAYSSYVNPEHGGACGLLGYGWTLPTEYFEPGRRWPDNRIAELDGVQNTYDGAGNLIEQRTREGTTRYLYDGAHRLRQRHRTDRHGNEILLAWYLATTVELVIARAAGPRQSRRAFG
jgi:YD repeat-containing protein